MTARRPQGGNRVRISLEAIPVQDAVGAVLAHDLTRIVPGEDKGPIFRKGHMVRPADISTLLDIGKEHIYVYRPTPGILHENDAARRIAAAVAGEHLRPTDPAEGRINLHADCQGVFDVDVERLTAVNSLPDIALATLHTMQEVAPGQPVAGTRIIPLLIEEDHIRRVEQLCAEGPILHVRPLRPARVGIVTTGSEIYHHRIEDKFGPVLRDKFSRLGCSILGQRFTSDDVPLTVQAIHAFRDEGADMIVCTGGMSVDPDDRTPASIRAAGAEVESYGAPTFPGAMFLLARLASAPEQAPRNIPVLGLPGCVMYYKASIFDLIVPRLLADIPVNAADIAALGHGGFCAACSPCRYPLCPFGKG